MASSTVACNVIFPELLNQHNYEHWSSRVETYLLAEDLWDVVQAEPPRPCAAEAEHKAWTKKNAKALHAIKNSCGADMFSLISKVRTAKGAWEILEKELKSEERGTYLALINGASFKFRIHYDANKLLYMFLFSF
jgi:hypothetical protein